MRSEHSLNGMNTFVGSRGKIRDRQAVYRRSRESTKTCDNSWIQRSQNIQVWEGAFRVLTFSLDFFPHTSLFSIIF